MPVEKHLEVIFEESLHKQRSVGSAAGLVPRGHSCRPRIQVEAVGDSEPVYYESMPKGEEGNRRAEIFVQG